MIVSKRPLFVGGNARSGTTALVQLLNCHPAILVLMERYLTEFLHGQLTSAHFARDRLLAGGEKAPPAARLDAATYVGDKYPALSTGFDLIDREFPGAALVYVVRNPVSVAESYQARFDAGSWKRDARRGIAHWNDSVRLGLARARAGKRLIVVAYEQLFRDRALIDALFAALDLDPGAVEDGRIDTICQKAHQLAERPGPRNEDLRQLVSLQADFAAYRALIEGFGLRAEPQPTQEPNIVAAPAAAAHR